MGPSASLNLSVLEGSCVLFGDETSFSIGSNVRAHLGGTFNSRLIFEVNSVNEARLALDAIGVQDAFLIERVEDDSHLAHIAETVSSSLRELGAKDQILTGCGRSIQSLRQTMSAEERSLSNRKVKAYWAPGKVGRD